MPGHARRAVRKQREDVAAIKEVAEEIRLDIEQSQLCWTEPGPVEIIEFPDHHRNEASFSVTYKGRTFHVIVT